MKVLIINTSESNGGAAKAANRLHKGLRKIGVESFMLVRYRQSDDPYVIAIADNPVFRIIEIFRKKLDALPKIFYPSIKHIPWSINWVPNPFLFYYIRKIKPDIINLHWINGGFMSIPQIGKICKLGLPVYWTLHDQWPLTGMYHYVGESNKINYKVFKNFRSYLRKKISRLVFKRKLNSYKDIKFIATTNWMKHIADKRMLNKNKTHLIPLGIDTEDFKPVAKNTALELFDLPTNKKIILFGAVDLSDPKKGMYYLITALNLLKDNKNIILVTFGSANFNLLSDIPIYNIGHISDLEKMRSLYNCCDVFVSPSLKEAFGQTFLEALLCGKPIVGFDKGGQVDLIQHKKNGYLAKYKDAKDLARGIIWCIENNQDGELSQFARKFAVDNFALELQAQRYKELFELVL